MVWQGETRNRLDPHFYHPRFEKLLSILRQNPHETLGNITKLCHHKWDPEEHQKDTFRYIEINSVSRVTGEASFSQVPVKEAPSRAQMMVRKDDIIVSLTRPHHGSIALINDDLDSCVASTGFAILREIKYPILNRTYLYSVLRSQLCLSQMLQRSSGGNYPAIGTDQLMRILIPIPKPNIQSYIVEIMQSAYTQKKRKDQEADALLDSIDDYVLRELGIEKPVVETEQCFVVYANETAGKRIDSHYHQPYFKKFYSIINSYNQVFSLKNLVNELDYGLMPTQDYADSEDTGIPMIRVTNLLPDGSIEMSDVKYIPFDTSRLDLKRVKTDDILMVQCGNTTGKTALVPKHLENYTFGSFMFVIRGKREIINQHYLFAILSNRLIQEQIRHTWNIVTVRPNTSKPNVENLLIPVPSFEIQDRIAEKTMKKRFEAAKLIQEANSIVEAAKEKVEQILLAEAED